jgi:signal transduction histidine kinase/ActR/RegA family two-component response regulator
VLVFALSLLAIFLIELPRHRIRAAAQEPAAAPKAKALKNNILILVTRNPSDPWAISEVEGMLRFFQDQVPAISPFIEYLDWQNKGGEAQENRLADYYAAKYADRKITTIIAQGPQAPIFLMKFRDRLFPGAQGVFCGSRNAEKDLPAWLTGVLEVNDAPGSFRLARALQPNLQRLVVLEDSTNSGRAQQQSILEACAAEAPEVRVELLKTENVQQLFETVESLPQGTAVLMTRARLARQFMVELRERCPVPIYGLRAPLHLPGILGGSLLNGEEHGAAAAEIALRLSHGERAESIAVTANPPHRFVVHHDQMVRFGFPLSALPEGTEILGEPPGVLETHGRLMVMVGSIVLVLLAAVFTLVFILRQKRAAATALARSLSTLDATFDSISDGVLVVDLNGRVANLNERFLEMWGIPRDLQDNERDEVLLHHVIRQLKDPATFIARVKSLYAHPEECSSDLIEFSDGRVFERDSRPHRDGGKIVGRVWSFRDISRRVAAERDKHHLVEQLAQSQKMEAIGTLAGGIAHDFNNILTGVIGYSELARARLPATHPSAEDLGHVLTAGERARELVRRILTFSRKQKPEKRAVSLKPVIGEILQLLRATIPASIEIRSDFQAADHCVLADPAQIHQGVLNLATNAVHAMGGGPGTLEVSLQTIAGGQRFARENARLLTGDWVRLSVGDTGHGMDPVTVRRIFEPFYTTKQPGEGTGLGLAVVHGIVTAHGGVITVESTPGKGSTFRLHFPLAEKSADVPEPCVIPAPLGRGERVLVVDDESAVAEVARNFLTGLGYRPTVCHSPEQALEELRTCTRKYAAVVTDLSMPRMTGLDFIRRVHAQKPGLPCVLCTGFVVSASTEKEASQLGVMDVVTKPYSRQDLGLALDRALHGEKIG